MEDLKTEQSVSNAIYGRKPEKKQTLLEYTVNKFSRQSLIKENYSVFAILRTISEYLEIKNETN